MLASKPALSRRKTIAFCLVFFIAFVVLVSTLLSSAPGAGATGFIANYVRESLVQITNDGGRVDWSPDGATIYFDRRGADGLYDVWAMNPDGSNELCITCDRPELPNNHQGNPEMHPGGRYLVFQVEKAEHAGTIGGVNSEPGMGRYNDLWVWDKQEDTFYPLTDVHPELTSGLLHPHFSNDGAQLFWSNIEGALPDGDPYHVYGDNGLAVADFAILPQPHLQNVAYYNPGDNPVYLETHGFGPDDNWLYFSCTPYDNMEDASADICRMDFATSTEITSLNATAGVNGEPAAWDEHAHLSPFNDAYAWASSQPYGVPENNMPDINANLKLDLWLMGTDGGNQQRLTFFNDPDHPDYRGYRAIVSDNDWNPDGSQIIIYVQFPDTGQRNHIWLLNLDPPEGTPTPTPSPTADPSTPTPTIPPTPTISPTPTPIDAPIVHLLNPADGAELTTSHVAVTFAASNHEIGAYGESHIRFYLDNNAEPFLFFNGDDPAQFGQQTVHMGFQPAAQATWMSSDTLRLNDLPNGPHTLTAQLVDALGNTPDNSGASQTITFSVNVPPDDVNPPDALLFIKEAPDPVRGMGTVFDNPPAVIGDLYLLTPVTPGGALIPLTNVAAAGGGVMDPELSWDGQRVLFAMRQDAGDTWHIWEMNVDGSNLRQITFDPPFAQVNDQDPAYLPDGGPGCPAPGCPAIIFASDRLQAHQAHPFPAVITTQLFTITADGADLRLVEPNPSANINPQVFTDGRVSFDRWDYLTSQRSRFTVWEMNQDGSAGSVSYGGFSPPYIPPENVIGIERRQLSDRQMVGIFTTLEQLPGKMAIFDDRSGDRSGDRGGNAADLPAPLYIGPEGLYRTPHPLTTNELVYSYSAITDTFQAQFGLYTMPWTAEEVLVDDPAVSTAHGPGTNYFFRVYNVELAEPGRVYIEITGSADDNNGGNDDDLWVMIDGEEYLNRLTQSLDGDVIHGLTHTFRIDVELDAGTHLIQLAVDATPTLQRVRIMRAIATQQPVLLYDDPEFNELSPIPVRARRLPPVQPETGDTERNWGTFVVRDVTLRGDSNQPDDQSPEGDPNYPFHLDLAQLAGLRVYQSLTRRDANEDILAGVSLFEPVRVLGVAAPNESGTAVFTTLAQSPTAWELIGHNGAAIVHERVWSLVQPGEVRSCAGCHEGPFPYTPRDIGPLPAATDLRARGEVYTFVDQVLPLFQSRCQACHMGDSPAGGLNLRGDRTTFAALMESIPERVPEQYIVNGEARQSFLFQLLTGNAPDNALHQARLEAINAASNHTTLLTAADYFKLATWLDTGGGFAYLVDGETAADPQVVGVLPDPNSGDIPANSGIAVRFNAPMDRATVDATTFTLQANGAPDAVAGIWEWGGNRELLFRPTDPLAPGQYQLTLNGNILDIKADTVGQPITATFSVSFTVGNNQDVSPPQIIQFLPDGSLNTPITPVVARFNEPIAPGSVAEHTLWVKTAQGYYVDGRIGVSHDGQEAAFVPWQPFTAGDTYTLYVGGDVRDLAGNPLNLPGSVISHTFTIQVESAPPHHSLVAERITGNDPEGMVFNAGGDRVLIANQFDDTVSLYDTAAWDVLNTYDVDDAPLDVTFSPDSALAYVLNFDAHNVQVLRLADGQILTTTAGLNEPYQLALNHAGTRLYVAGIGDPAALYQLDADPNSASFGQVTRTMFLNQPPQDIAVSPDDRLVYFTTNQSLIIVDTDLWVQQKVLPIASGAIKEVTLSPDGRQAIVPDLDRQILQVFDLIVGRKVIELPWEDRPEHVAYSPDGRFIYVTGQTTNSIAVLDVVTLQVVAHLPLAVSDGGHLGGISLSADGRTIAALEKNQTSKLWVFHLADPADTIPPQVEQIQPGDGQAAAPLYGPVRITLSEAIDCATVDGENVQLAQNNILAAASVISSTLSISHDNQSIWLQPANWLEPGITYTLSISAGLRDLAGNYLPAAVSATFTTAVTPAPAHLGLWARPAVGSNLSGIAATPDGSRVLAANYGGMLYFVDTGSWDSRWIDLEGAITQAVVNPASALAYVLRPTLNDVVVIDLATETPIDMDTQTVGLQGISVGDGPYTALHHPNQPLLYVVNENSGDISVIDTLTQQEVARWPVNGVTAADNNAHGIALSPDGQRLYVTFANTLSTLDASNGHLIHLLADFAWSLQDVVVTAGGDQVWFASASTHELIAVDTRLQTTLARIPAGDTPTWLELSPDGETLYVSNKNDGVYLFHWRTGTLLSQHDAPGAAYGLALSPDGQHVYVANVGSASLLVYENANMSDVAPPQVTAIQPDDGQTETPPYAPLHVSLSEAIDLSTINEQTVQLAGGSGVLTGTLLTDSNNQSIWLQPANWLEPGTAYTLSISAGLRDLAGNYLPAAVSATFTTAVTPAPARLGLWATPAVGSNLSGVAATPDGSRVLAANYGGMLYFVDTGSWDSRWIDLEGAITQVVVNPSSALAYVLRPTLSDVVVVDLATEAPIDMDAQTGGLQGIPVGESPYTALHHPDQPLLYVVNENSGDISVIDTLAQQEIARWPVNGVAAADNNAHGIALSPDGQRLYVTFANTLSTLDASDGHLIHLLADFAWSLQDVVVTAGGDQVWFASASTHELVAVDTRLQTTLARIPAGDTPTWLELSPDGQTLYVSNKNDGVYLFHWRTGTLLNQHDAPGTAYGLALSPDGQRAYVANVGSASLLVYENANMSDVTPPQVTQAIPGDGQSDVPVYASVIVNLSEAVDRATVSEQTVWLSQEGETINGTLNFGPDNDLIWFAPDAWLEPGVTYALHVTSGVRDIAGNALPAEVVVSFTTATALDPVTLLARPQTFTSYSPMSLALSPDDAPNGGLLAVSNRWQGKVTLLNPATIWPVAPLIATGAEPKGMVFNGDGSLLYTAHDGPDSLVVINVAMRQVQQTFTGLTDAEMVTLSPDGAIAYVTGYDSGGVDRVDLNSGQVIAQWHVLDRPGQPAHAPDGTLYVPAFDRLWRYHGDGVWTELTIGGYYTQDIVFSPDGRYAFLSQPQSDQIQIIDLVLWQVAASIPLGDEPRQMALSADGRVLILVNASAIQVVDSLTQTILNTTTLPGSRLMSLVWDEEDGWIFVGDTLGYKVRSFDFVSGY